MKNVFKKILILIVILPFLMAGKCKYRKYPIMLQNHANHPIAFYVAGVGLERIYPDTSLLSNKPAMHPISPGQSTSWSISYPFEMYFEELPADTLSVFLFNLDTVNHYDWSVIRAQYKVLRRYDLSLDDLKKRNYTLTYP